MNMRHLFFALIVISAFSCGSKNHNANIDVAKQYVEAVENKDYKTMESLLADNYTGHGPSFGATIDKASSLENWKVNIENLYDNIEYVKGQFAGVTLTEGENKGDWVANWAELKITYKNSGETVTIWANTNYKVENGKIVKSITMYNEADVMRQLGYSFSK